MVWCGFQVNGDATPVIENSKRLFKVYPLSALNLPLKVDFVSASDRFSNTLSRSDYGFFEEVNDVVQREPEGRSRNSRIVICNGYSKGRSIYAR